jgi:hypothetical protein
LRCDPGIDPVFDRSRYPDIDPLVDDMFFTQPPCKRVVIFTWESDAAARYKGAAKVLYVLHKEEGITIDHLVSARMAVADDAMYTWTSEAIQLALALHCIHWKHDIWEVRKVHSGMRYARDILTLYAYFRYQENPNSMSYYAKKTGKKT